MFTLNPAALIESLGLLGVIAIVFAESGLFFGFFLPGDSLLFTAGLLAAGGFINIYLLIIGAFLAAVLGDNVGYWFGKKIGPTLFSKEDSFFWNKKHIEKSQKFFEHHGKKAIVLARFMPIVRTFTPIIAGVGSMDYKSFVSYNIVGGAVWVSLLSLLGFFFGKIIPDPEKYILPIVVIIIIVSFIPGLISLFKKK